MSLYELRRLSKHLGGNADLTQDLIDQGWQIREEDDDVTTFWRHLKTDPKATGDIAELQKMFHTNANNHGFWDDTVNVPEKLMLMVSELSEALEENRDNREFNEVRIRKIDDGNKPEGFAIELADCIIRILDFCGWAGIDIVQAVALKHEFNKKRKYKHGKTC